MIIKRKLKNGIPVFFDKIEELQSVTIGIFISTGSKYEKEEEHGISHLLEHMLFKGTTNRSSKELSEAIDDIGGNINAYTSKEVTSYYIQLLSSQLETGIDILGDMLLNSVFCEEELEKEKKVVIEEINMYEDIPEEKIHDVNTTFAIGGNQSNTVLGTSRSVSGITRDVLVNYFKKQYVPSNMVISLAGNMNIEEVMKKLELTIGKIEEKTDNTEEKYEMSVNSGEKILRKETNQVHLCVNAMGTSYLDSDRYKYSIISNILGGNMSSRLFQKIREERGLAYSVYSYMSNFREGGLFTVYSGTTVEAYKEVIELIFEEFEDIKVNGVSERELERAKNQFLSSLTFGLENSRARMSRMANSYLIFGEIKSVDEIMKDIRDINHEDIKRVAMKMFDKKYYSITVLGDIK